MDHAVNSKVLGGTLRLGKLSLPIRKGSMVHKLYNEDTVFERHRHRYEFNNLYRDKFIESGMVFSGLTPDGQIIETLELNEHPFFVGCLFHPEFKSRPNRYHPLFKVL